MYISETIWGMNKRNVLNIKKKCRFGPMLRAAVLLVRLPPPGTRVSPGYAGGANNGGRNRSGAPFLKNVPKTRTAVDFWARQSSMSCNG